MNDVTTATVEHGAEEVKRAGDVEVTDVDVPVFVRRERLHETGPFFRGDGGRSREQPRGFQDPVNAGGSAGDDVLVDHHERESPIAFERMTPGIDADLFLLVFGEPVVAGDPGIVFVDLAETMFPVVEFAGGDADPRKETTSGSAGLVAPVADVVDDAVTGVVRHPTAGQISPSSFFKRVCSSRSSAMTASLRASLASSFSIF